MKELVIINNGAIVDVFPLEAIERMDTVNERIFLTISTGMDDPDSYETDFKYTNLLIEEHEEVETVEDLPCIQDKCSCCKCWIDGECRYDGE